MTGGLVHAVTAYAPFPEILAWLVGGGLLLIAGVFALRAARGSCPLDVAGLAAAASGGLGGGRALLLPAGGWTHAHVGPGCRHARLLR